MIADTGLALLALTALAAIVGRPAGWWPHPRRGGGRR